MEGVASEAASLAGHLQLGKLIYLYDDNNVTIEGFTKLAFSEDVPKRFEAYGWHTLTVEDGNNLDAIEAAIREAQSVGDQAVVDFSEDNNWLWHAHGRHAQSPQRCARRRGSARNETTSRLAGR